MNGERPPDRALRDLHEVDCIVVYKIDRLSRSLMMDRDGDKKAASSAVGCRCPAG